MRVIVLGLLCSFLASSCGPEADAREICACFNEVHQLEEKAGTEKMNECLKRLDRFRSHYRNSPDDEKAFEEALDRCR